MHLIDVHENFMNILFEIYEKYNFQLHFLINNWNKYICKLFPVYICLSWNVFKLRNRPEMWKIFSILYKIFQTQYNSYNCRLIYINFLILDNINYISNT